MLLPQYLYIYTVYIVNMGISTISVRVPDEVKQDLKYFEKEEKLTQTSEAARKLLMIGLESWQRERALQLLEQGKVSFSKAAHIAKMDLWSFADLIQERKIVWIKDLDMLREDIRAAK